MRFMVQFRQFFLGLVVGVVREPDLNESLEARMLRALIRERANSVN
jgi:hypothetical protein